MRCPHCDKDFKLKITVEGGEPQGFSKKFDVEGVVEEIQFKTSKKGKPYTLLKVDGTNYYGFDKSYKKTRDLNLQVGDSIKFTGKTSGKFKNLTEHIVKVVDDTPQSELKVTEEKVG